MQKQAYLLLDNITNNQFKASNITERFSIRYNSILFIREMN